PCAVIVRKLLVPSPPCDVQTNRRGAVRSLRNGQRLVRRTRRSEHQLGHPDEKTVAADDPDGDYGPDQHGKDEKGKKLFAPGVTRCAALRWSLFARNCHLFPACRIRLKPSRIPA